MTIPGSIVGTAGPEPEPLMGTGALETSPIGRRHLPGLDGLRGGAILLVLVCHYSLVLPKSFAPAGVLVNGWTGVDLFFVLSGFLITGILFDAKGTRHYFRNFYARRVLRIFPLYYGFLFILLISLLILKFAPWKSVESIRSASATDIQNLWGFQPWLWTYTANIRMAFYKSWTDWLDLIAPLWSLSVEEQFYLVWPLVVCSLSHRKLMKVCVGIMIGALGVRLLLTARGTDFFANYVLTPTRADSLAAGALVALLLRLPDGERITRKLCKYSGAIGAVLVCALAAGFDPRHPWLRDLLYSALALFFAALLFWSIDGKSLYGIPKRFYEVRLMRALGGYSYGIYVVHLPILMVTKSLLASHAFFDPARESWIAACTLIALNMALTCGFAFLSFHLYEKQFLKLKRYFPEG